MNLSFYEGRFDSIQAMRGLAAMSVVFHHISFIENGSFGVDIFFCISGFIMMYVTHISTERFMIKRLIRIVPLYYFITFVTYMGVLLYPEMFENTSADISYLIKSCLFLTPMFGGADKPLVKVGWTLNYEMLFYVIIWIAMHINKKYRGVIASCIIIALVITGRIVNVDNVIMIEFIYGIAAYEILKNIDYYKCFSGNGIRAVLCIIATSMYGFMVAVKYMPCMDSITRIICYGVPAFILYICIFIAGFNKKIPAICVYLGNISYSIYLLHYFIARLFNRYGGNMSKPFIIVAVVIITIACSSVCYNIFEKKIDRLLRRVLFQGK